MAIPRQWWPRLAGLLAMALGSSAVLALLVYLNGRSAGLQEEFEERQVSFDVTAPPPPPPPHRPKPRPKPRPRPQQAAPLPTLGASLAGLDFGLPTAGDALGGAESLLGEVGEDVVMTEEAVDEPPRAVQRPPTPYPARARSRHVEGYATLSLLVSAGGQVQDARVLEASPPGVFEESALQAVRAWTFEPAFYQGRPVAVRVRQTLRYELQ